MEYIPLNEDKITRIISGDSENSENLFRLYGETIAFTVLLILGLITNGPLLIIYLRSKHTRSMVDKFLINMLIADALCAIILIPTILSDLLMPEDTNDLDNKTFPSPASDLSSTSFIDLNNSLQMNSTKVPMTSSKTVVNNFIQHAFVILSPSRPSLSCSLKKSLLSGVSTASILASLEIAVERYLAVVNPLHYHELLTKTGVIVTSCLGTVIALGSAILSSVDPCQPVFPACVRNTSSLTDSIWWPSYTLVHVSLFFIIPILLMTFIYVKIWWEARRQRAKMHSQYKKPFYIDVPNYGNHDPIIVENAVEETRRGKRFYLHPIILRLKLIERLVAPRMDRAARVAICTLCVTILCWGPYYFVETSHALQSIFESSRNKSWHHYETILPLFFASIHPVIAPFFYAYRYKRVREEVLKTCCMDSCIHKTNCAGLPPRKSILLDFHDTHLTPVSSKSNQILTPVCSEVGIHNTSGIGETADYYSLPSSPKLPKFHIGSQFDVEIDVEGCNPNSYQTEIPVVSNNILRTPSPSINLSHSTIAKKSQSLTASLVQCLSAWIAYSTRWGNYHRESVTSTSSVTTLLNGPMKTPLPIILDDNRSPTNV